MQALIRNLSLIEGVLAVGLGGSRGLHIANEHSDYDFVICRYGGPLIAPSAIMDAMHDVVDAGTMDNTSGFVSALVSGRKVEVFQKDLALVEKEIQMAKAGKFRYSIRQLFPHGDLSTCIISHIVHLEICAERNHILSRLKRLAEPFPELLMQSMIKTFLSQATIARIHAGKIRKKQDLQYFIGLCSAFVFYANIVIFAINRKYPVLERGGAELIAGFQLIPEGYPGRIQMLFSHAASYRHVNALEEMNAILGGLRNLAPKERAGLV